MIIMQKSGFTLIELLVIIVIIGILSSLVTIALTSARVKARDAKRISDMKEVQLALELYNSDEGSYPTLITPGQPIVGATSGRTYMTKMPNNPTPWAEGGCTSGTEYAYRRLSATSYNLRYCLAGSVNNLAVGYARANQLAIHTACTYNCTNRYCGEEDGCGGLCNGTVQPAVAGVTCSAAGTLLCGTAELAVAADQINSCTPGTGAVACGATTGGCTTLNNICSAGSCTRSSPCNNLADAKRECSGGSGYGDNCGGGYLVCKEGDNDCGNINLVAAPSNCTLASGNIGTVCNCGTDTKTATWGGSGVDLNADDAVDGRTNVSSMSDAGLATYATAKYCDDLSITIDGVIYADWYLPAAKELAAMVKSSEPFFSYSGTKYNSNAYYNEATTNATLAFGAHYDKNALIAATAESRVSGLGSTYYWSSTEYSAAVGWLQYAVNGNQGNDNKTNAYYVRCVRRF